MLPRINRLKSQGDFKRVFDLGYGTREGFLFLKVAKNDTDATRLGFLVSKSVARKATQRNRIKRLLREAAKENLGTIKKGLDIVMLVKGGLRKDDFPKIKELTLKIFRKARILTEDVDKNNTENY